MITILAGILVAFSFYYYMEQKRKIKNEQRHEDRKERFEQLLETLKRKDDMGDQEKV